VNGGGVAIGVDNGVCRGVCIADVGGDRMSECSKYS
jgi:hypothetical protein